RRRRPRARRGGPGRTPGRDPPLPARCGATPAARVRGGAWRGRARGRSRGRRAPRPRPGRRRGAAPAGERSEHRRGPGAVRGEPRQLAARRPPHPPLLAPLGAARPGRAEDPPVNLRAPVVAAVMAIALLVPAGAHAHPLGNFSINHLTYVQISNDGIALRYILDQAEIPTFQERGE